MKLLWETSLPYPILALLILAVFYGIYLIKQQWQKHRGIQTMQIGRRRERKNHTVETCNGGHHPCTALVHRIWMESSVCKRPFYWGLCRYTGRFNLFDFRSLYEGQLASRYSG